MLLSSGRTFSRAGGCKSSADYIMYNLPHEQRTPQNSLQTPGGHQGAHMCLIHGSLSCTRLSTWKVYVKEEEDAMFILPPDEKVQSAYVDMQGTRNKHAGKTTRVPAAC